MSTKGQGFDDDIEVVRKKGNNYLFAVAIDAYRHSPPLYNCVGDVDRIKNILHEKYQFEPDHTFTLYNEEATEKNIFDTFKKLVNTLQPEDNLLILYSGHGEYEEDIEEGYWIPIDAHLGDFSDYVSNSRIAKYIKAINAHHIFLIVDSCFSGSLFAHRNINPATKGLRLDTIPSRWLLTAGRNEVVSDGKPGDHSPFADNIIYFLENNQENSLSVVHLINAVVTGVIYNSRQTPRGEPLQDAGHRGGQFFFHKKGINPKYSTPFEVDSKTNKKNINPDVPHLKKKLPAFVIPGIIVLVLFTAMALGIRKMRPTTQKGKTTNNRPAIELLAEKPDVEEPDSQKPPPKEKEDTAPVPPVNRSERAWLAAKRVDSEEAYRKYIASFSRSKWADEARKKIADKYRYTLYFTPEIKGETNLKVHLNSGFPPFRIQVSFSDNEKLEKMWDSKDPCPIDLKTVLKQGSTSKVLTIIVTDHNFKKAGHKLPIF